MPSRIIATCFVVLALAACNRQTAPRDGRPGSEVRLPADVTPVGYDVTITPDVRANTFRGSAKITVTVGGEARRITLNAADLSIDRAVLEDGTTARVAVDGRRQTATFTFPKPVPPGRHDLLIDYRGKINTGAFGLFSQDYQTEAGENRRMLITQFESADYRRLAPSWDDPGQKAVFQTSVVVPEDQTAVSNMPVATTTAMAGGLKRVSFQPTPKMSSYLNFLAVGDLERVSRNVDGVDVGVVVRRGVTDRARFALDAAAEQLRWYNTYFGMRYPLPKLDLIAAPGSGSFGAMENWGAILLFEPYVLADPQLSTEADRQYAYIVIAHEIAHQWFGNLVTMRWWDDLWLNESFASWMENKATAAIHPEWNRALDTIADRDKAMRLDAGAGTHPIVQPADTLEQVSATGDAITYEKGAAVIRMLEAFVGADVFRDGVRAYLKRFAYSNAARDDLWREIEAAAKKPVMQIARDFTLQAGVPLISVEPAGSAAGVSLRQGRFGLDQVSKAQRAWHVPVTLRSSGGGDARTLIVSGQQAATAAGEAPIVVNYGQAGYFRALYSQNAFARLAQSFEALQAADQLGLLLDSWALGAAGYAPVANVLELTARLSPTADPKVWAETLDVLAEIDHLYAPSPARQAFRDWASERLAPLMAKLGWEVGGRESASDKILRERLITLLGQFASPEVVGEARARFEAFRADPDTLAGDIRPVVLDVVGRNARPADFDALRALARRASDPQEKRQYLEALAGASDPRLARRVLEMALTTEVPANISSVIFAVVASRHPQLTFDTAAAHQQELNGRMDRSQQLSFYPRLLSAGADPALADRLGAFAQRAYPAGGRREADKAQALIHYRAAVRSDRLPEIDRWLQLALAARRAEAAKALAEEQARARRLAQAEAARVRPRPKPRRPRRPTSAAAPAAVQRP